MYSIWNESNIFSKQAWIFTAQCKKVVLIWLDISMKASFIFLLRLCMHQVHLYLSLYEFVCVCVFEGMFGCAMSEF